MVFLFFSDAFCPLKIFFNARHKTIFFIWQEFFKYLWCQMLSWFISLKGFWYVVFRETNVISLLSDWTCCPLNKHTNVANCFESDTDNNWELLSNVLIYVSTTLGSYVTVCLGNMGLSLKIYSSSVKQLDLGHMLSQCFFARWQEGQILSQLSPHSCSCLHDTAWLENRLFPCNPLYIDLYFWYCGDGSAV